MALLATHRSTLSVALDTIAGLNVYDTPRDRVGTPCAIVVAPESIEMITMGPGGYLFTWQIRLLVTRVDLDSAIDDLDPYISTTGTPSVIAKLNSLNNQTTVTEIRDIGNYELDGVNYLGCDVIVEIVSSD